MKLPPSSSAPGPSSSKVTGVGDQKSKLLPDFVSSVSYGTDLFTTLFSSRTPLGNFCHQSMKLPMMEDSHCLSKQLWPCPIPASLPRPSTQLVGRRRSRYKLRVIVREHLRIFVATSNWLCLGRPKTYTPSRLPISAAQSRMLSSLEHSLRLHYRLSSGASSGLDRALGKFTSLSDSLEQLLVATESVRHDLDTYSRVRGGDSKFEAHSRGEDVSGGTVSSSPPACPVSAGVSLAGQNGQGTTALPINPDRIRFKQAPAFHAESFISDPLLKAGFLDPHHFRAPRHDWPPVRPARVMCSREQLLRLFHKWDQVNCLKLLDSSASDSKYRCGLFAVYKNSEKDRQILNPIPENGRTICMNSSTLTLAHGSLLCNVFLDQHQDLVIAADDLEDFYHSFVVSSSHAHRNHIHGVFPADLFQGWNAWDPSLRGKLVVGCFNTLAMGTSYAVEVAQHTHTNLLRRAGVLEAQRQVCYRKPLPRTDVLLLLCIDDLAILQKVPRGMPPTSQRVPREDQRLMSLANSAYSKAKLKTSSGKAVRDCFKATILGGEVDGRRGIICAPRLRILVLSKLTLRLVYLGWTTKHLLETLVGSWIFIMLFRRPLLSLFNDVFHEGSSLRDRHEVFQLSTGSKHELLLISIWAPFAFTNMRAQPLPEIFCSDASLVGGGVCRAEFSRAATLELSRIAEQRGFYTRIDASALGEYQASQDEGIFQFESPKASLTEGFLWDFCEVFKGSGHLTASFKAKGLICHPGFEIKDGPHGDVLNGAAFLAIVGLICRRVVRAWHVAPVCTTFGTLRRPRLRSLLQPFGFDPSETATHEGNRFAMRGGFILWLCIYYGLLCSMEQPGGSVMYRMSLFTKLLEHGCHSVRFPFCGWGTPFQKLSWWIGNSPFLLGLGAKCTCGWAGSHFRVQGTFDRLRLQQFKRLCRPSATAVFGRDPFPGEHVAHFSAAYPKPLCDHIAAVCAEQFASADEEGPEASLSRPLGTPPTWMGQLARSLKWQKLLQYGFRKRNHINVNEHLSYRSLLKHLSKSQPSSRFCTLLDSRVIIGCNAKGRSSSKQLNFYLGSTLPYIIGGDLYPYLLHVGTGDNASDDISRFISLRDPTEPLPPWLTALLSGDPSQFDQVRQADSLQWPYSGWARLIRLLILRHRNP